MDRPDPSFARNVHVTAELTARWDGKEYDLRDGVEVKYGIVEHWQGLYPDTTIHIEEAKEISAPDKPVGNPLEAMDRGAAFSGLKQRGRPRKE